MAKLVRVIVGVVLCGLFASCSSTTPKIVFKHGEVRGRLQKNGLRFVVMPDATTQLVEVDVRYEVGAREDPPGKAGLAHLVEHLMFQQRPDGPNTRSLRQTIERLTLRMNAYTIPARPSRRFARSSLIGARAPRMPRWCVSRISAASRCTWA